MSAVAIIRDEIEGYGEIIIVCFVIWNVMFTFGLVFGFACMTSKRYFL